MHLIFPSPFYFLYFSYFFYSICPDFTSRSVMRPRPRSMRETLRCPFFSFLFLSFRFLDFLAFQIWRPVAVQGIARIGGTTTLLFPLFSPHFAILPFCLGVDFFLSVILIPLLSVLNSCFQAYRFCRSIICHPCRNF